jgi:ubiquinone biosynthesis UbiH/UbiF/VisC/COQ6 family hydroxylase
MSRGTRFDAVVVGGRTVGAASALALAAGGRRVALVDRSRPESGRDDAPLDSRVVAVSPGSRRLLEALGAWDHVRTERIAPYTDMRVLAGAGEVRFRAAEHGLTALGWIVELAELDAALWQSVEAVRRVEPVAPADVERIAIDGDARVELADGAALAAGLLIGADGANSRVRAAAGIDAISHYYNQRAIVAHLDTERPNPGTAWQRFTDLGPMALLPLPGDRSSLVWSVPESDARRLLAMSDAAFIEALAEHGRDLPFGACTAATRRHALPLVRRQSRPLAAGRVALVGDAARSVHPLAGQGLNLGLGDVAALVDALADVRPGDDPDRALARYARRRYSDSVLVAGGIHAINEARSLGGLGPIALGAGFAAMRIARPARDLFVRRACGLDEVDRAVNWLAAR